MPFVYPWTALVTVAAIAVYIFTMMRVARARGQFQIAAPATGGHPDFERVFRVQANTLEQMAMFLPVLWLFALIWSDGSAAVIGVIWPIGRLVYALGYYRAAEHRNRGFAITALSSIALLVGVVIGIFVRGF